MKPKNQAVDVVGNDAGNPMVELGGRFSLMIYDP